jgi:hypothetical protein
MAGAKLCWQSGCQSDGSEFGRDRTSRTGCGIVIFGRKLGAHYVSRKVCRNRAKFLVSLAAYPTMTSRVGHHELMNTYPKPSTDGQTDNHLDLPGVPAVDESGESDDGSHSAEESPRDPEDGDESPFTKTYVAIDGVEYDDFTEEQRREIEQTLKELTIFEQDKQTTGVRVLGNDVAIMEVEK